jgi:hypothetical protein
MIVNESACIDSCKRLQFSEFKPYGESILEIASSASYCIHTRNFYVSTRLLALQ